MQVPSVERSLGITAYCSSGAGIGGKIRAFPGDFIVQEILLNGSKASLQPQVWRGRHRGKHTICILIKRSKDTFLALEEIARRLKISRDRVGFGGIKDAHAVTAQYISVRGVPPERIAETHFHGITLYPVSFAPKPLKPNQIWGNDFTITVRGIQDDPTAVKRKLKALIKELSEISGVPNFFGYQRFGTVRPVTHLVGKQIANRDFEGAVMTLLSWSSPSEPSDPRMARDRLKATGNLEEALHTFPERLRFERIMLEHLHNHPTDHVGALRRLPLGLRRLFLQAYQSYLFNRTLSRRMELKIPLNRCEIGDCVVPLSNGLPSRRYWRAQGKNLETLNERIGKAEACLAIPLIGYRSPPSIGIQAEVEEQILAEEGVSRRSFYVGAVEEVSTRGGLRTAVAPVHNLVTNTSVDEARLGKAKIVFQFQLSRGSYATVFMREIIKPPDPIAAGF